jgi:hypothetical protein
MADALKTSLSKLEEELMAIFTETEIDLREIMEEVVQQQRHNAAAAESRLGRTVQFLSVKYKCVFIVTLTLLGVLQFVYILATAVAGGAAAAETLEKILQALNTTITVMSKASGGALPHPIGEIVG